ncbi:protein TRIGALACTOSYLDIACYLGLYCEROL 4, chloroplastic [Nymphaea colorata]|nr:protein TRIGALACTOSYLDIACYLGLYCEROL 4, chloroplastic [Nymphaea colorata]
MAKLRTAMDCAFWDVNLSSAATVDGVARAVPGDPFPVGLARAGTTLRAQQLPVFARGFPLGLVPNFCPPLPSSSSCTASGSPSSAAASLKDTHGSFALQTPLFINPPSSNWWVTLMAQLRPKKLFTSIKAEVTGGDELEIPGLMSILKIVCDKTLYAAGLCSQLPLTPNSSLVLSTEAHGGQGKRSKAIYFHKFSHHDVTLEAAWPELFIDRNGTYWEVPASVSLDLASLVSKSGLRYRFGIHKNGGHPQPLNTTCLDVPASLMPGWCAKAAFSYEKNMDIWREKDNPQDAIVRTKERKFLRIPYDIRMNEPHSAVSGLIGGACAAWLGGNINLCCNPTKHLGGENQGSDGFPYSLSRSPFSADLFGSLRYTLQHGKFRESFYDFTRLDARLDICSGAAFAKGARYFLSDMLKKPSERRKVNPLASPKLNIIFQQQVAGPIVFRIDSRISANSPATGKHFPHVEDVMYSLCYSLKLLESGKVVFWYSPKRKEGMVELRLFEF